MRPSKIFTLFYKAASLTWEPKKLIRQDYSIKVSECVHIQVLSMLGTKVGATRKLVNEFLKWIEPEAVEARRGSRFRRRCFWSAGVMEYWSIDQHDKWGRFGLWLHLGIDPYSSQIAWLKIWWCNRNPCLLISYYLEAGRQVGGTCYSVD